MIQLVYLNELVLLYFFTAQSGIAYAQCIDSNFFIHEYLEVHYARGCGKKNYHTRDLAITRYLLVHDINAVLVTKLL